MMTLTVMPGNKFVTGIMYGAAEVSGILLSGVLMSKISATLIFNIGAITTIISSLLLCIIQLWIEGDGLISISVFF